jgi:hypothetical protein
VSRPQQPTVQRANHSQVPAPPPRPTREARVLSGSRLDLRAVLLVVFGAGCAVSPLFRGYYDFSVWGWLALAFLVGSLAVVLARPARPTRAALCTLGGLLVLWLWSYLSQTWGESAHGALTEANRWLLYAAVFTLVLGLLRTRWDVGLVLGAAALGIAVIGGYVAVRMAAGDGVSLFFRGRLNDPLGYTNGQAGFFALGFWPFVAAAERRHVLWSPVAVSLATLLAALTVVSQARGVVFAMAASAIVVLAVVPGRRQRLWVLLTVAVGLAPAITSLLDVYSSAGHASFGSAVRHGGAWILLASAVAGLVWAAANSAVAAAQRRGPGGHRAVHTVSRLVGGGLAAVALIAAIVAAPGAARTARTQVHDFTHLGSDAGRSRFLSGGGNRYDYWRVAWSSFEAHPLRGVGAGNYATDYFRHRRTTEDIRQPHSVELQTLAELGLVGAIGLGLFLVGAALGLARRARAGRADSAERAIAVAAGGTFAAWLAHTSVDWLHLIPGLTGIALASGAALCASTGTPVSQRPVWRRASTVTAIAAGALVAFGALTVARPLLAQHDRAQAQHAVARDPAAALRSANRSLSLDPDALPTYYAKSAAYARLGDYADARDTLLVAARREPHAFITWTLLGDLAARRVDAKAARGYYRHALQLNPRDRELRRLAARPPVVTSG